MDVISSSSLRKAKFWLKERDWIKKLLRAENRTLADWLTSKRQDLFRRVRANRQNRIHRLKQPVSFENQIKYWNGLTFFKLQLWYVTFIFYYAQVCFFHAYVISFEHFMNFLCAIFTYLLILAPCSTFNFFTSKVSAKEHIQLVAVLRKCVLNFLFF